MIYVNMLCRYAIQINPFCMHGKKRIVLDVGAMAAINQDWATLIYIILLQNCFLTGRGSDCDLYEN